MGWIGIAALQVFEFYSSYLKQNASDNSFMFITLQTGSQMVLKRVGSSIRCLSSARRLITSSKASHTASVVGFADGSRIKE